MANMRHFWLALSFLTRLPVPNLGSLQARDFGQAALYYPIVGGIIGGILCLIPLLLPQANALLSAAIIVVGWAIITGGLHLDGIADSADAWLGGLGSEEKTHRILKDPVVGAAGAIAISSVLLLKTVALSVVLDAHTLMPLLVAPIMGRTLILAIFLTTPYVRAGGLASDVTAHLPYQGASRWLVIVAGAAAYLSPLATALVALGVWLSRRLMLQRIRGCTGDTAGAMVEIGEMLWLVGYALTLPIK